MSTGRRAISRALTLTWYQGTNKPEIWTQGDIPQWASGVLFVGDKGMLLSDYGKHVLLPEEKFEDFTPPAAVDPEVGRPPRGVDPRLQDRRADDVQLRVLRLADRGEPPRQRRVPRRQEAGVGRRRRCSATNAPRPTGSCAASTARGGRWPERPVRVVQL